MKFSIIAPLLASAASFASASPQPPKPTAFNIMTLRSASPIHFGQVSAARGTIWVNLQDQDATCRPASEDNDGRATFYLKDGGLYLYNGGKGPTQRLFVDRSGMGQGVFRYLTGDEAPPRYAELTGFDLDENDNLNFQGQGFLACPRDDGSWTVWADVGILEPGYNKGCLGFSGRTLPIEKPIACKYSKIA